MFRIDTGQEITGESWLIIFPFRMEIDFDGEILICIFYVLQETFIFDMESKKADLWLNNCFYLVASLNQYLKKNQGFFFF